MVDFTSGYVPPGVYISSKTSGAVGSAGIGDTVVCLVGRGQGYQNYSESISFAAGDTRSLTQLGIIVSSIVVTGVSATSGGNRVTFVVGTDYSVTQSVGVPTSMTTTITRIPSGTIPPGAQVQLTYNYTSANYYQLNSFTDYASLQDAYGQPLNVDSSSPNYGNVLSPLSLAAQFAFENGANVVYAIALAGGPGVPPTPDQFTAAYALTMPNYEINLLVPLFEDAVDAASLQRETSALYSHLNSAENQGYPRMAICSASAIFTGTSPDLVATGINYRRIIFTWPQAMTYFNTLKNRQVLIDGFYLSAACAGYLADNDPNQGLTRAQLRGFVSVPATNPPTTVSNKNLWSSKGVSVAEMNRQSQLIVRHGVTTDVSNISSREISIVRCQDALFELLQITLEQADMIGSPITEDTTLSIKGLVVGALETALTTDTIQAYDNLLVNQQFPPGGDPTLIQVTFSYSPTYPLNYITVIYTLDLSTGTTTLVTDTAGASGSTSDSTAATT